MSSGALWEKKDVARNVPDPSPVKGDTYIWRCIDVKTRLRVANHISKTREVDDAEAFLEKVASRLAHRCILITTDKLRAYPRALRRVFGVKTDECLRKVFPEGFLYGRILKVRTGGRLRCIERAPFVGTEAQIQARLEGDGLAKVINTSYIERDNLSFRQHNGRTTRKTLSYSKNWQMHQHSVDFEDALHNFTRVHSALRLPQSGPRGQKWAERTPAMAAGLTDHIWTINELVTYRLPSRL